MNITRKDIITELKKRGYNAIENDVYKNDVKLEAILIKDNIRITPMICIKNIIPYADSVEQAADMAEEIYIRHREPAFDLRQLMDREFIKEHVRIGIEKSSRHVNALHRPCEYEGLIQYLYIRAESWSARITDGIVKVANLNVDELWQLAIQHTNADITIESMSKIISEMTESVFDEVEAVESLLPPLFVISNETKQKGAAAILNHEMLADFAKEHNVKKLVIIPSSIHECILVPCDENEIDIEHFDCIIRNVNETQVDAEEQLLDHALVVNF